MRLRVTRHAVQRFQERVQPCTAVQALACLRSRPFRIAVEIGAQVVRFPNRGRAIICYCDDVASVVTVIPDAGMRLPPQLVPDWLGGLPLSSAFGVWRMP